MVDERIAVKQEIFACGKNSRKLGDLWKLSAHEYYLIKVEVLRSPSIQKFTKFSCHEPALLHFAKLTSREIFLFYSIDLLLLKNKTPGITIEKTI